MLSTQFALYSVMLYHKVVSSVQRQLVLNIVFHGVAALASLSLAIVGIVLKWCLTFVEQYLFLQALFVWSTYRLSSVLHEVLPGKERSAFDPKTASGSNVGSTRAVVFAAAFTDDEPKNDIPW